METIVSEAYIYCTFSVCIFQIAYLSIFPSPAGMQFFSGWYPYLSAYVQKQGPAATDGSVGALVCLVQAVDLLN